MSSYIPPKRFGVSNLCVCDDLAIFSLNSIFLANQRCLVMHHSSYTQ